MIPVYINNRNRLTTTKALVEYLAAVPEAQVFIIDNDSTWKPLLEWYASGPCPIFHLGRNVGCTAPWKLPVADLALGGPHYAVTDSDLDLTGVPVDLLAHLRAGLAQHPEATKAGLSLEINNLPNTPLSRQVRDWERQFWSQPLGDGWFNAAVDTTFAMYRATAPRRRFTRGRDPRPDRPYTARHTPWYLTPQTVTEEESYYQQHCDPRLSFWRKVQVQIAKKGR